MIDGPALSSPAQSALLSSGQPASVPRAGLQAVLIELAILALAALALHLVARNMNYLLFHSGAELFSIAVATTIFVIAINCRDTISNQYITVISISYLYIGFLDLLHTLSYKGMGIFVDYDYYAPQLWIAARYMESLSMLAAFFLTGSGRRVSVPLVAGLYAAITAAVTASIFYFKVFPVCFVAGQGLTDFKIISEYVISATVLAAMVVMYRRRLEFDTRVYRLLQGSMVLMIAMELCFTLYVSDAMSDAFNEAGHLFKIAAFYLVYKAVVVTGVRDPIALLYRDLKAHEISLLEAQRLARLGRWEWHLGADRWTWTDQVYRMLGVGETVVPSLDRMRAAIEPQDRPSLDRVLRTAAETGAPFELLLHFGDIRIAQMRGEAVADRHGTVTRLVGTLQDITINQFSVESSGDMVAWITPTGHFAYVNRAACALLGYGRHELLKMRLSEIDRTMAPAAFADRWLALKQRGTLRFETVLTGKDGTTVPVDISENHVHYADQDYNVMFVRDIAAHKAAQAEITVLKDMYAALSYTNHAIIRCQDRDRLFDEVVRIAVDYGHFRLAWIGLIDQESLDIRPVAAAGEATSYVEGLTVSASAETPFGRGPTGSCVRSGHCFIANDFAGMAMTAPWHERQAAFGFTSAAAFPIFNGGKAVGALTLYSSEREFFTPQRIDLLTEMSADISSALDRLDLMAANRKQQDELRKAVDILTVSNTELERFAFIASHDLQEPLRSIILFSQMIERSGAALSDQDREYFNFVKDAASRMRLLIKDLLEYSRVTDRGVSFAAVPLDQACEAAIENLGETIRDSGAQLRVGPLPTVTGNRIQLTQLFQNLIANAIKFRNPEAPPEITISAGRLAAEWIVTVKDNGIGVPPTEQDIFEIFRRLHSEAYSGSGVGLAICRRIVQHHKGRIWYVSSVGQGSEFHFSLPAAEDELGDFNG